MNKTTYHVFHNNTTEISNGNELIVDNANYPSQLTVTTFGTATTSVILFEANADPGDNWGAVAGLRLSDFLLSSNATRLGELWIFDISGFRKFRCRISNVSGGDVNITGKVM
jgi:hypothetical protein